jgi:hypothetical protein
MRCSLLAKDEEKPDRAKSPGSRPPTPILGQRAIEHGPPTVEAVLAPAICNAIIAATGRRIPALPLEHHEWKPA